MKTKKMSLFQTWKEVMFNPMEFFEKLPAKINYKEPSVFYIKIKLILGLITFLFMALFMGFIFSMVAGIGGQGLYGLVGIPVGILILLGLLIGLPLMILFSWGMLFVGAGIHHLFVMMFDGTQGYKETYKALAYAQAPMVLSFIPIINWAAYVYAIVLQVIGISKRQKLSIGKSVAIVLIPIAVIAIFLFTLYFVFVFSMIGNAATLGGGFN
jgi:hypothetical protein